MADGDNHIQVVVCDLALYLAATLDLNCQGFLDSSISLQFSFFDDVVDGTKEPGQFVPLKQPLCPKRAERAKMRQRDIRSGAFCPRGPFVFLSYEMDWKGPDVFSKRQVFLGEAEDCARTDPFCGNPVDLMESPGHRR